LGKPGTVDAAVAQLQELAGRTHELWTAVCLMLPDGRRLVREVGIELEVRALTREEALAYIELDQPLDCAGSYKIEAAGPWLFTRVRGDDPTAIEGLPMMAVGELLRQAEDLLRLGALDRTPRQS
jgi:septum formation protein